MWYDKTNKLKEKNHTMFKTEKEKSKKVVLPETAFVHSL